MEERQIDVFEQTGKVWKPKYCLLGADPLLIDAGKYLSFLFYHTLFTYATITDPCHIVVHQKNCHRTRCFDVTFPFVGLFTRFQCTRHLTTFRITNACLVSEIAGLTSSASLYLLPRTILTPGFVDYVSMLLFYVDLTHCSDFRPISSMLQL